jgi:hypothetical protein
MLVSDPLAARKREDLAKLRSLQAKVPRLLEILRVTGDPPQSIELRLRIPTAKNASFPRERQETTEAKIDLPANYPLGAPTVHITTPVWNPNVYSSGKWCYGSWTVTENLELFVIRMMKLIALDPAIVNIHSPANSAASTWYVGLGDRYPELVPTVMVTELIHQAEKPKITWRNIG